MCGSPFDLIITLTTRTCIICYTTATRPITTWLDGRCQDVHMIKSRRLNDAHLRILLVVPRPSEHQGGAQGQAGTHLGSSAEVRMLDGFRTIMVQNKVREEHRGQGTTYTSLVGL